MPRIVEIPGVARLQFPDDFSDDAMLAETRNFYEQSKQGAIGAAGAATVREPARQVGGAMKAAARLTDWLQPPDVNPETGIPIWQQAESTFFGPETVTPVEKPAPVPVEQTGLFQAGESLQRGAEKMFPVNPLRQEDFLTQVGSGIGSLPTSIIPYAGPLIYAASAGEDAAEKAGRFYDNKIAEAMAAGNGAEANRLQEEKKYQQALQFGINAPLGYATERFMGVVPGLKQITEGGGKLIPKLAAGQTVENAKKLAGYFAKQGVKPTVGEFTQEGLEQAGGNLSEMAYNPEAEFLDGVINASGVGGTVGATTSIPLSLLGSKLRKNRLDRIKDFRDTRLAEGPLSDQQINEINDRIVAGQPLSEPEPGSLLSLLAEDPAAQSSVGGNNAELLPNSTATLAGINSGGAPSGPINITPPPVTGGAPDEAKIPDMALETDVADEEIVAAVTPETVATAETSVAAEEVQPLTVEETQEYNDTLDAAQGGSVYDILNDEQLIRFEELAGRVRQLEQAGFEFDEVTGWTKPGVTAVAAKVPVAPTPAAPQEPTQFKAAPDFRYTITEAPNYGLSPLSNEDADFELERLQTQAERGRLTADGFAQSEIGRRMDSGQMSGVNSGLRSDPVGTIKTLRAALVPAPAPTSAPAPTPAAAPKPARTVVLTPGAVTVTETPAATPAAPAPAPTTPAVTAPKKGRKAREWAFKGDILDDIINLGGVMSKSQAKKDKRLEKIQSLYDDAPRLDAYFNKIFAGRKRGEGSRNQPDVLLQELAMENPGKYGDMTVAEFWSEIEKAARGRKGDVAAAKEEAKAAEEGAAEAQGLDVFLQAQDEAFVDAQAEEMQRLGEPDGPVEISVGSLAIGDRFFVQGELFEVTSVTPDGQYTIRDGEKFGVQQLTDGDTIFVDREPIRVSRSTEFLPPETEAPPQIPRLGAMQQQGDLLSGQSEAFALVGERGVDYERKQREAQAAARAAAEAKAAREKAQTTMDLGDAVAEASDAIAQFVESITPKAGITEGPTPEESARRVLEALTRLASAAIRSGIQNASQWATSLRLKLGPALQHAWDRAQGSTAEPTPEVIADVSSLPERAATDFGMIYSTPGDPVTTKRGGFEDVVAGRRALTPEVRNAGFQLAVDAFNEAGVKFRQVGDALFAPVEGVDQEAAGRELVRIAKDKIAKAKSDGRSDTIAELIQSLRNHFGASEAFSPQTRDELYLIGQSEASEIGRNLASLKASVKDFVAVARNVRGFLTSAIYDNFNGESVKGVLDKIMTEFRGQFTEAEIQKIVGEKPDLQEMLNRFGVLALADTGGRVYRAVQARLKVKKAPTQKAKQQREIENEAIDQIIENALALGVTEPPQPPNRKLTADERLALMTRPGTQAKVQKATEDAVKEAEFNAGWNVMMASAAGNEELLGQYRDAMAAGEDPDPEAIEEGLDLPQYAHWRTIRDGFLNYSPTTLKLAQDVIRGRFKGAQFGPKKVAPPAPAKIDLARLVQQPNAEMSRVIGEQLAAIERVMDLAGASPEAKARVMQMITANVGSQVQLARQRVLNNFLDVKAKTGPTTASDRLQRLINAGITEDPRYRSQKTRDLLKRVAKTYLTADELSGMATRTRAEKLAFLTGKLNQITAAENLTDEWMQGAVWTYLTERMMEAENAAVSQIVGAKDVNFDPAQPKTDAQREADRAKAVERLAGGIRAGLLDQRIAESVAKNPALQRLVPKMSDLVKRVLNTPQAGQAKLAQAFSEALLSELAIDQALADKTGVALAKAFQAKFERARIRALELAVQKLTPKQREEVGPGRPLWQKIEEFVNAGGMNSAALLQSIAKKSGWKVPTDEEVSRLRDLARLEQELSTATEEEISKGITDDIKAAMNLGRRADIMREIQMRWARMTMPIRGNKQNLARAINEVTSAQLLFKPSFVTKQLIDVATQMFYYTPTRAVATAVERYRTSRDPNRASRLWKDTSAALEDAYKARFNALNMALTSALEAAKGRAEKDTIMGIQSGIRALDRINAQASEYAKNGDYARSALARMIGISQLSFRFASSLDAFQGVLAEQQEIGAWTESQLRLQGMAPEQARKTTKTIIGDAIAEYALAQAIVGDDPNISPKERRAAAWNVVRARQYQRIKAAGLDTGALKELTQDLRSTIGWNIEETGGLGGVIGQGMKNASDFLAKTGIPNPVGRFSNAIAIGINRALTFAGGGFVPKAFEGSAWYKTETDKTQRKIEAATGLGLSGAFAALVLSGALRVFTKWPDDKEEADLWEREGHRPNTIELELPGGKILRVSLNTGPIQIVRPVLAAIGELQYQVARRNRLNQKAETAAKKKGLKFEPRELTAKDVGGALVYGAYSAVAQGRTASGMIGSGVYRQAPDMGKIAAGAVSPLIPFAPLLREAAAMSGAQFNPKDQTFINLLVPTPWSGKVDRNFLGDPVGTPRAQERIMSVLTGGTAIVGGEDPDRAYQVLAKTGWTPATPQSNKFFQFGRVQRQATPEELTRMQEVRAVELKTRISQMNPATATKRQLDRIEDIANAKAKKSVGIR